MRSLAAGDTRPVVDNRLVGNRPVGDIHLVGILLVDNLLGDNLLVVDNRPVVDSLDLGDNRAVHRSIVDLDLYKI